MNKEVRCFKMNLFGKDVLSIIDSYDPEGFEQWSQHIGKVNKEYYSICYYDVETEHLSDSCGYIMCNYRYLNKYTSFFHQSKIHKLYRTIDYKLFWTGFYTCEKY